MGAGPAGASRACSELDDRGDHDTLGEDCSDSVTASFLSEAGHVCGKVVPQQPIWTLLAFVMLLERILPAQCFSRRLWLVVSIVWNVFLLVYCCLLSRSALCRKAQVYL